MSDPIRPRPGQQPSAVVLDLKSIRQNMRDSIHKALDALSRANDALDVEDRNPVDTTYAGGQLENVFVAVFEAQFANSLLAMGNQAAEEFRGSMPDDPRRGLGVRVPRTDGPIGGAK